MKIEIPDCVFAPFAETLVWRQDRAPHLHSTFSGVVLHGSANAQNAGHPLAPIVADPWTVSISKISAFASGIRPGDTIRRDDGNILMVQSVTADDNGYLVTCTSNERPKL